MDTQQPETTIEGVIITSKVVRTGDESFSAEHIQSVQTFECSTWGNQALLWFGWFMGIFNIFAPWNVRYYYLGWVLVIGVPLYGLYLAIAGERTFAVAIMVGGRRHSLASFSARKLQPDQLSAAKAKAASVADAVQALL